MVVGNEASTNFVRYLKTNSGKKGQGMPVVRNPQFYFREGLCWNEIKTHYIRCRLKGQTVNSNKSMAFYAVDSGLPIPYIVILLNSEFIASYVNNFVNNTQTFGIDDARQIFIIMPEKHELQITEELLNETIAIQKKVKSDFLEYLQKEVDIFVNKLYINRER